MNALGLFEELSKVLLQHEAPEKVTLTIYNASYDTLQTIESVEVTHDDITIYCEEEEG